MQDFTFSDFILSGRVAEVVLAIMVLEFVALVARAAYGMRRTAAMDAFFALGPGVCLALALRAALVDANWISIAVFLAASFPLHIADLVRRRR